MSIKDEINDIFNEYENIDADTIYTPTDAIKYFDGTHFYMVWTSPNYWSDYEKDKYSRIKIFYDVLKKTNNLRKARKASNFNINDARHYISFFNKSFEKVCKPLLYIGKIEKRNKRIKRFEPETKFYEFLDNLEL